MKLEVLGCAGGEGIGRRATSFLINDHLLIDAGSVVNSLDLERQNRIKHVLVTHAHLDHIKDIGFIADNTFESRSSPLQIIADESVIKALRTHYFNWVIWPDFSRLPSPEHAVIVFEPCKKSIQLDGLNIEFIEVNHPGGGYGFLIQEPSSDCSIVITGDTGDTRDIWHRAQSCKNLKAIFADTALPDDMQELAGLSGHMTPGQLLKKLTEYRLAHHQVYCYHLKPSYHERVLADIESVKLATFRPLLEGESIDF